MMDKTTMTVRRQSKERLIGLFDERPKTQDEMLNRVIDELEELQRENEILREENQRLKGEEIN
ncbi:MAG: hypothetical protein HXS54_01305 [Theionarchaea archaeon]|nr:hypothetical protein [Theionarchaea archaeon]